MDVHIPSLFPPLHDRQTHPELNLRLERKIQNAVSPEKGIFFFLILPLTNIYSCFCSISCSLLYSFLHLLLHLQFCYKICIDFSGLCIREDVNSYRLPFVLNSVALKFPPTLYSAAKSEQQDLTEEFLRKFLGFEAGICVCSVFSWTSAGAVWG